MHSRVSACHGHAMCMHAGHACGVQPVLLNRVLHCLCEAKGKQ